MFIKFKWDFQVKNVKSIIDSGKSLFLCSKMVLQAYYFKFEFQTGVFLGTIKKINFVITNMILYFHQCQNKSINRPVKSRSQSASGLWIKSHHLIIHYRPRDVQTWTQPHVRSRVRPSLYRSNQIDGQIVRLNQLIWWIRYSNPIQTVASNHHIFITFGSGLKRVVLNDW